MTRITTDSAREFAKQRLAAGVTNSTVNNSLALLRRMLRIAHEDGKLQIVPVIRLLKPNVARRGFLPREKFDELLGEIPDALKPLIAFLYYCGVRLGEASQIKWEQVNLETCTLRLEDEQTKTGEARTVPLPNVVLAMLEDVGPKEGLVFCTTNLRKSWQRACAAVGLGTLTVIPGKTDPRYEGLIIHDLRRSAIRNLVASGVSEKVAMTISGHKTRSVFDRYHIVDAQDVLKAMRKVEQLVPARSTRKLLAVSSKG